MLHGRRRAIDLRAIGGGTDGGRLFALRAAVEGIKPEPGFSADELGAMNTALDRKGAAGANLTIPAGYTYLAQFVAHDLAFHAFSDPRRASDNDIANHAGLPALDLSSLYGAGPEGTPHLYRVEGSLPHRWMLNTGNALAVRSANVTIGGPGVPEHKGYLFEHAGPGQDLPRCPFAVVRVRELASYDGTAIIADPRNDENLLISQLTLLFCQAHNQVCRTLSARGVAKRDIFTAARALMEHSYRQIIADDLLAKLMHPREYAELSALYRDGLTAAALRTSGGAGILSGGKVPEEFWRAAYRAGHAMIQHEYVIQRVREEDAPGNGRPLQRGLIQRLITLMLQGGVDRGTPVRTDWVVEWERFFFEQRDLAVDDPFKLQLNGETVNYSHPIGLTYASGLADRSFVPLKLGELGGLPGRDLAHDLPLPSVWAFMAGSSALDPQIYLSADHAASRIRELPLPEDLKAKLVRDMPLLIYVLVEAELQQRGPQASGAHLGRLGSRIVGETMFATLSLAGRPSDGPEWDGPIGRPTPRSMPELLRFARGLPPAAA